MAIGESNLVKQINANYDAQINAERGNITALNKNIAGVQESIDYNNGLLSGYISERDREAGLAVERQTEHDRLADLRHKHVKAGGCKRDLKWDNSCLKSFSNKQEALKGGVGEALALVTSWNGKINGIIPIIAGLEDQKLSWQREIDKSNRLIKEFQADRTAAITAAAAAESTKVISDAEAANMALRITNQAAIDRIKQEGIAKERQDKIEAEAESKKLDAKTNTTYAVIGGVVLVFIAIAGIIVVVRSK